MPTIVPISNADGRHASLCPPCVHRFPGQFTNDLQRRARWPAGRWRRRHRVRLSRHHQRRHSGAAAGADPRQGPACRPGHLAGGAGGADQPVRRTQLSPKRPPRADALAGLACDRFCHWRLRRRAARDPCFGSRAAMDLCRLPHHPAGDRHSAAASPESGRRRRRIRRPAAALGRAGSDRRHRRLVIGIFGNRRWS